jgi:hypothetical protein
LGNDCASDEQRGRAAVNGSRWGNPACRQQTRSSLGFVTCSPLCVANASRICARKDRGAAYRRVDTLFSLGRDIMKPRNSAGHRPAICASTNASGASIGIIRARIRVLYYRQYSNKESICPDPSVRPIAELGALLTGGLCRRQAQPELLFDICRPAPGG